MRNFAYHKPATRGRGGGARCARRRARVGRRHDDFADDEAAARRAVGACRFIRHRRTFGDCRGERRARNRRDNPPTPKSPRARPCGQKSRRSRVWRNRSAIRKCAIAARSAAPPPTTIRRGGLSGRDFGLGGDNQNEQARDCRRSIFRRLVCDHARRGRDYHRLSLSDSEAGGICEVSANRRLATRWWEFSSRKPSTARGSR